VTQKAPSFVEAPPQTELATQPVISVQDIVHRYNGRTALDGVSFDVRPAELFGLLGPNGSGKTTLFRILSTLMVPSAGRAMVLGYDAAQDPAGLRRHIGVVFQAPSIDGKLTAYENLWHQGHLYGLHGSALKARIQEILARVGLADRARDQVETFSGGMARRVELAKGLLHHPTVLLLDEPTTGLDPGARRDLWQYLQILRDQEQVSVIVTTHLMEEAERCDRLAILSEGKLVALGTPGELKREIGCDVILLDPTRDPEDLAHRISTHFNVEASVLAQQVRIELENGHRFITGIVEAFPGEIQAVSVSKPTLEDVFIHRTGHRFWTEQDEPQD
jgi:ABC-2 type transport system ATP-binding protein